MRLKGQSAIITCAASGIGEEIAARFVNEGAKVAIADLRRDAAAGQSGQARRRNAAHGHWCAQDR